jgi:hypothetical protein
MVETALGNRPSLFRIGELAEIVRDYSLIATVTRQTKQWDIWAPSQMHLGNVVDIVAAKAEVSKRL